MADVTMTYSSLETAANNVNTAKGNLDDVIAYLSSAVSALQGNWSGESYEAFVGAWEESKPTMQKLSEAVARFAPELTKAVASQQETEKASASAMSGLSF